jgi:iron-sulfur cluster repair protein YtfE (RIC family)
MPIKRHPAIVELSKDHHFALLLVWKIREGLKNSIEINRISNYILHFFETELIQHFKEEEELLFSKLTPDNKLRRQAEEEHSQIRELIKRLKLDSSDKNSVEEFGIFLENHIRFEERILFNYLQENISEEKLYEIASLLKKTNQEKGNMWKDNFWIKKKSV